MNRVEVGELHYITPIANVSSILEHGILSHRRAQRLRPQSIAKPEVQEMRANVRVPGGRALHEYANLYICARNPMMYKRAALHGTICVLRVSPAALDLPGAIVTDQNAASGYALFAPSPGGLAFVDRAMVFAEDWRHPGNPIAYYRHRSIKCAEVLVPDAVAPNLIVGAYVSCQESSRLLSADCPGLPAIENRHLFFR
jgi:hypothetical protein